MRRQSLTAFTLGLPWLLTLLLFWAFPVLYSFVAGFTDYRLLSPAPARWIGWENYASLLSDPAFIDAFKTTVVFVVGTVPVTTVLALLLALLVNRHMPGQALFRAGYFLPSITSMVVVALIFTHLYEPGGYVSLLARMAGIPAPQYGLLYDRTTALPAIMAMDIWMACGYYMLIFLAGLKAIPTELYEAAQVCGASPLRTFFSVTLPLLRPTALFVIVINTIKSFQVFVEIFVMTKGKFGTTTLVYFIYERGLTTGFEFGYASAAAVLLFLVIAVFSVLQFILVRGRRW